MTLPAFCSRDLGDGARCYRLEGECPIHDEAAQEQAVGRSVGSKLSDVMHELTARMLEGRASPGTVTRVVRAWAGMSRALRSPQEEEAVRERELALTELHGLVMNGYVPRDAEEWTLALEEFGVDSMLESFRFMQVLPKSEPIPVAVVDAMLERAAERNFPAFRIPSRMLDPESHPGGPVRLLLPYTRIEHDPEGVLAPLEFAEKYEWDWWEQGRENGVIAEAAPRPGPSPRLDG